MRIFLAGAGGVIGRRLVPMLVAAGHEVTGTTRSAERAVSIESAGARAVIVDVFDRDALMEAVVHARPEVVIHQLTDLATPPGVPIGPAELERNARIRGEGTANLVAAAVAADARRFIAQSIAWLYAPGPEPHDEADPLLDPPGSSTRLGVVALERQVLADDRFEGVVLRYGRLYGGATGVALPPEPPSCSVDSAARAAMLAVDHGRPGIYNIVDDGGPASNRRARDDLGWVPG